MSQIYSNPARSLLPHALPNVETFYVSGFDGDYVDHNGDMLPGGWYWQACFSGCLPDGEPMGPFDTEEEAIADAQDDYTDPESQINPSGMG